MQSPPREVIVSVCICVCTISSKAYEKSLSDEFELD